jgi:transcriptional regulator with XRE-family HTH domain
MPNTKSLAEIWGEAIRETRHDLGLSLADLAFRAGIDAGHLSRGERGLAGFGDESRMRIAAALGKRVEDLFPYPETESACPPADSAPDADSSPTPATKAETRSPAPSAEARERSDREANPADERRVS